MRTLRLSNPAGLYGDLSAFVLPRHPPSQCWSVVPPPPEERPVSARLVPAAFGHRCCAPGCGDKIKPVDATETMYEVIWTNGTVRYVEEGCVFDFVHGHVDYGGGYGPVPGLPNVQKRKPFTPSHPTRVALTLTDSKP